MDHQDTQSHNPLRWFSSRSLKVKLVLALVPPVVFAVLFTGYLNYRISNRYTEIGLERSVAIHTMALAHELETHLNDYRLELLSLAQERLSARRLHEALATTSALGSLPIRALAWFPPADSKAVFLVADHGTVMELSEDMLRDVRPSPFAQFKELDGMVPGEVRLFPITEMELPLPLENSLHRRIVEPLVQMATVVEDESGGGLGILLLAFDAKNLRNILSLYNSPHSPIYAFPRSEEQRYAYMLDTSGWVLFEAGSVQTPEADLSTLSARNGVQGVLGKPGLPGAFRPDPEHDTYWEMVATIGEGGHGVRTLQRANQGSSLPTSLLAYAPVWFRGSANHAPVLAGGVAFVDRSQLPLMAGYHHLDLMFFVSLITVVILVVLIIVLARFITRPIHNLAQAVRSIDLAHLDTLDVPHPSYETDLLKTALNSMIARLQEQKEENRLKDEEIRFASLQERASLEPELPQEDGEHAPLPEIIGTGPQMAQMKSDILKASRVDVDVLVIGETGTGKQLAAEAIHNHSSRQGKPFISINCGALDENLLLDTLFGHTKGAYTEARSDRKGAFLEADGGTLFLDEIQATSPKGQQALLRALAMRKIKPLGSDHEIDVNVRLIAATNVDLPQLIDERKFREDLYYRLRVLTINVPPLREHRESIPALTLHYLDQAKELVGKPGLGLSRGAVEKMNAYDWPGNIRELVNCITRAAVMVEGTVIQANDIQLEGGELLWQLPIAPLGAALEPPRPAPNAPDADPAAEPAAPSPEPVREQDREPVREQSRELPGTPAPDLNERQLQAFPALKERGGITRSEYQELVGGDLSSRTAIYDLNDLVQKGLLVKVGSGPATRYKLGAKRTSGKTQD